MARSGGKYPSNPAGHAGGPNTSEQAVSKPARTPAGSKTGNTHAQAVPNPAGSSGPLVRSTVSGRRVVGLKGSNGSADTTKPLSNK